MARPIEPMPILYGEDAREFLRRMEGVVMTPERLAWLKQVAEESRAAEERGKRI